MVGDNQSISALKYIAFYALIYLLAYTVITALSSIVNAHLGRYATSFILGAYTATKIIKENDRLLAPLEKAKLIIGTFATTLIINILYTTNLIGAKSIDNIDECFIPRQLILLIGLWGIFGPGSDYIYNSGRTQ